MKDQIIKQQAITIPVGKPQMFTVGTSSIDWSAEQTMTYFLFKVVIGRAFCYRAREGNK
jgi:hypothetical protein